MEKLSTTAYHSQTDGLTEHSDWYTFASKDSWKDWDAHFPFVLFACRASLQDPTSTKESPLYLLRGSGTLHPDTNLDTCKEKQII